MNVGGGRLDLVLDVGDNLGLRLGLGADAGAEPLVCGVGAHGQLDQRLACRFPCLEQVGTQAQLDDDLLADGLDAGQELGAGSGRGAHRFTCVTSLSRTMLPRMTKRHDPLGKVPTLPSLR